MNTFQILGKNVDIWINWFFDFRDNDVQLLIWGGLIATLLVFSIEYLRKPRIEISFSDYGFDFNLPSRDSCKLSKNWKFQVRYKNSFLNNILFRYSINNLKARVLIYDSKFQEVKNFQAKPDTNPNVYEERDISAAFAGINLTKGESDNFPFVNKSEIGWLLFEVWQIFLCQNRTPLNKGTYFVKVNIVSDQAFKKAWTKINLTDNELIIQKLNIIEKVKLMFI